MAQRCTFTILITLTVLATLITAFRVRDLPKTNHDSAKKLGKCDNCDAKLGSKLRSAKIDSGKYARDKLEENEDQKHQPVLNSVKEPDNEENEGSEEDFSFLNLQEFPKDAFNKLEEKLDVISKSFWSLFGDSDNDDSRYEGNDADDDESDEDDESADDKDDEKTKISTVSRNSKIVDLKKKSDLLSKIHSKSSKYSALSDKFKLKNNDKHTVHDKLPKKSSLIDLDEEDDDDDENGDVNDNDDDGNDEDGESDDDLNDDNNDDDSDEINDDNNYDTAANDDAKDENDDDDDESVNSKKLLTKVKPTMSHKRSNEITEPKKQSKIIIIKSKENKANVQSSRRSREIKSDIEDDEADDNDDDDGNDVAEKDSKSEEIKFSGHHKTVLKAKKENTPTSAEIKIKKVLDEAVNINTKSTPKLKTDHSVDAQKDVKTKKHTSEEVVDNYKNTKTSQNNQKYEEKISSKEVEQHKKDKKVSIEHKSREIILDSQEIKANSKEERNDKTKKVENKPIKEIAQDTKTDKSVESKPQSKMSQEIDDTEEKAIPKKKKQDKKEKKTNKGIEDNQMKETEDHISESSTTSTTNLSGENSKHISDALNRRSLHKNEFEDFYNFLPTFAPNFSRVHNPECRRHGQIILRQLRGSKLWALNMLDATAKIPSGLLQGNGIQLGDFDQCLASRARVQLDTGSVVKVQGKYCLAWVDIKAEHPDLETPVHLAQAKNLIKSRIDDPGHFVPRFSTLSWGVCVPSPCEPEDVEVILRDAIRHYQRNSGVVIRLKVEEQDCHEETGGDWWDQWLELPTVLTLSFYGVIIMLVCMATIQDFLSKRSGDDNMDADEGNGKTECDQKEGNKIEDSSKAADDIVGAFSLYNTINKLTTPGTSDDIACIHGIRGIATIALLVAHKFLPVAVLPYTNRLKLTETVSSPLWSWCRAGWIFTDCFLLLSGTLTAYRIYSDKDTGAPKRLFFRYLRLTPALLALVLFYAYIWDNISSGPMWGSYVTKNAQVCKEGWWWNLFYVQNYFSFENLCAPQTHQLALDMQLTIFGGIIVWLAQERKGFFKVFLPSILIIAGYSRYTTVRDHRLTLLAYHGVSVSQLYRTSRLSYTSVLHRSTSYLIGISLGIALKKPTQHSKAFLTMGWIVSGVLWSLVWWAGMDAGSTQYRYNATFAAQYAALTPLAAAVPIAWVIYAVHIGGSDFLGKVLYSRPLVLISRLSYALYLCQFVIFFTSVGTVRTSTEFSLVSLIDVQEILAIFLSSTILTLTLIIPMQSLPKIIFNSKTESSNYENDVKVKDRLKEIKKLKGIKEVSKSKQPQKILAHREMLEEIPEAEIEYEAQRDRSESLEGILEEEENEEEMGDDELHNHMDDDLVMIDEQDDEGGWDDRESDSRPLSRQDDQDLEEWEWTANGRNGAQYLRHTR